MERIPIILTFDYNMSFPAAVCISSMMMSAKEDTFYDFFVLHAGEPPLITGLEKIQEAFPNMRLQYRSVGDVFSGAFEIRGITEAAYYRLLAPELIPEYDKAIYADVDILFRMDLNRIYTIDVSDCFACAVRALGISNDTQGIAYLKSIDLDPRQYYVSGFLLMNLQKMRENKLVPQFIKQAENRYKYQDQDILNIVCKGYLKSLPCQVSMDVFAFKCFSMGQYNAIAEYKEIEVQDALRNSNIHYNGIKPWKGLCPNFDQWWECYRKSPIYDPKVYFSFFYDKLDYLDQLPLIKRLKILARYFIVGKKKSIYTD